MIDRIDGMIRFRNILIIILLFGAASLHSQSHHIISIKYKIKDLPFGLTKEVPEARPVVALALSGGGARGLAQIGILKAFEEAGIKIDMIVGTSMGSIIGGLYSAGYTIKQLDSIAVNTNWDDLLASERETDRRELFVDQKITEDKAIFSLRLKGLTPVLPTSLNNGQKLSNYLNLLTLQAPIHVKNNFDELKTIFRAVCTDLVTGSPVIISSGSLSQAMRASSSVSFFLSPVKTDSMVLVDGGLVANIPVKIAKQLGADYIIAVNTTSSLHSENELEYPWIIADQIISIPMKLLNEDQLSDANIVLSPQLDQESATDFSNVEEIIQKGYKDALPLVRKIKSQIDSLMINNYGTTDEYFSNLFPDGDSLSENFMQNLSSKDSISSDQIRNNLSTLLWKGNHSNVEAVIDHKSRYSTIRIRGNLNPIINSIEISGITMFSKEFADLYFSPLKKNPYNSEKIESKIIGFITFYRNKGYSLADVRKITFDRNAGILKIIFDEGIISEIRIEGNKSTSESIIKREFPFEAGDYFIYQKVKEGLTDLRSTNLFNDILLLVKNENGNNIVTLKVSEKVSSLIRVGFRVDNENKAQLSLDLRDENLFGSGTELGLLLFGGARNRAYVLEHKSNRLFNTYLTYNLSAFYRFNDVFQYRDDSTTSIHSFSRSTAGEYRQIYYGTSLSLGMQVEHFGNLIVTGNYKFDEIKNKSGSTSNPLKDKIVSLKGSTTIDTQDKYPYPSKGFYFNAEYEVAQKVFGGDVGFTNFNFQYKSYFTINNVSTFSPKFLMGFADKTLPLSEEYSLGGQDSFFGMRDDEFRGRQIFLTSLEYRYRLPIDIFFDTYLKMRYDLGRAWEVQDEIKFKELRHGVGLTLSFDTPVGPADFSVGRSFLFKNLPNNPISLGDVFFYFSIGYYY
ncbi:MAG TPA: patatin-like phospholipase family protein [Ignavibacteriaceae bacterium]|nr:patatin-like phospholipase family protein [Ignavibacteriaceae bacterium]